MSVFEDFLEESLQEGEANLSSFLADKYNITLDKENSACVQQYLLYVQQFSLDELVAIFKKVLSSNTASEHRKKKILDDLIFDYYNDAYVIACKPRDINVSLKPLIGIIEEHVEYLRKEKKRSPLFKFEHFLESMKNREKWRIEKYGE